MRRWLLGAALGIAGVLGAGAASASVDARWGAPRVYDDAGFEAPKSGKAIALEMAAVNARCTYSELSREGPRPSDMAACEAAVSKVIQRGSEAIGPILAALDNQRTQWGTRRRLYDVLARTKDTRLAEPLIRGMARITTRKIETRAWEVWAIHDVLSELTHAPVHERLPGYKTRHVASKRRALDLVVDWRLWLEGREGKSHDELVLERTNDELAHAEDPDAQRAYRAVSYLLRARRAEGIAAGKKLLEREDFSKNLVEQLKYQIVRAEDARTKAVAAKKSPGPAPAASKSEPAKGHDAAAPAPQAKPLKPPSSKPKPKPSSPDLDLKGLS